RVAALAARRAVDRGIARPARVRLRIVRADLRLFASLPRAVADLAQPILDARLETAKMRDRRGRHARAELRAHVDRADVELREARRERVRLLLSVGRERRIEIAAENAVRARFGVAVTNQMEGQHPAMLTPNAGRGSPRR